MCTVNLPEVWCYKLQGRNFQYKYSQNKAAHKGPVATVGQSALCSKW